LYTSGPAAPRTEPMPQFPEARFISSAWQPRQFPADDGTEVAFAGRSNAGKSSALNAIAGRKDLARTSKTPGRTQLINFFGLDGAQRLVDLPGYGFAKVPERIKDHWQELLTRYIEVRASLVGLVIVMDARRPLTDFDVQMLDWSQAHDLATHILLTKADKLSRSESTVLLKQVRAEVEGVATVQLFSAVAKTGVDEARREVLALLRSRDAKKSPVAR
jgi:GTP-binding protein